MKTADLARGLILLTLLVAPLATWAQAGGLPMVTSTPGADGSQTYTLSVQTLLTLTALTFIPALRADDDQLHAHHHRALAAAPRPRHPDLAAQPGADRAGAVPQLLHHGAGSRPHPQPRPTCRCRRTGSASVRAVERGAVPLREFMLKQTREPDIALFVRMSNAAEGSLPAPRPADAPADAGLRHQRTEDRIPDRLHHLHPFLIIDMVVASVLMSMGMMMMSPVMVALPFKLMLFVLVDGWHLLLGSLVASFAA
jgi:flagellar biosynthetic protein FliP